MGWFASLSAEDNFKLFQYLRNRCSTAVSLFYEVLGCFPLFHDFIG